MRQVVFDGPRSVRWETAAEPVLAGPDTALVRPLVVATCDLDVIVIGGGFPLPGPFALGHEGIAEVVAVGDAVSGVAVGDRVVVPFQISCGVCPACARGRTGSCTAHPPRSSYGLGAIGGTGWGGFLADLVLVPHADAMLVPLPGGIDPVAAASASDNIPDALRTVGPQLADDPGADVLVVCGPRGTPSIGLYAAGIAVTLGAGRVVYLDEDPDRLRRAAALGAEVIEGPPPAKVGSFPITVDASCTPEGLRCALASTAPDGTCTSPSIHLQDVAFPLFAMYSRGCTFSTGRVHARAGLPSALDVIAAGFDPGLVTARVVPWDDAAPALSEATGKVIVSRLA